MTCRVDVATAVCAGVMALWAGTAGAQTAPTGGGPPDDTPAIRLGTTIFTDYSYTASPETTDADGNAIHASAFNVARAYLNLTGQISHVVAFRVTPDVVRETGPGSSLNGSLTFRLKYAYAQFDLDDWMATGSYARLGIQQTPYLDFIESIYRYRFQGTTFVEREGYFASADAGASLRYPLPSNYGDIHVGYYNGENYNTAEANDQKATMIRGTIRPLAQSASPVLRGIRATGFYQADHYIQDGDRTRAIGVLSFDHPRVNAALEFIRGRDRSTTATATAETHGFGLWATPALGRGWEALARWDHVIDDEAADAERDRTIVGLAYWFKRQGSVSSALMFDYDGQRFSTASIPKQQKVAVHALLTY